eukprot:g919.t1
MTYHLKSLLLALAGNLHVLLSFPVTWFFYRCIFQLKYVMPQCYFSNHRQMMYTKQFPAVAKVGAAHAGVGKMKVADHHDFEDFRSVVAMTKGDYCTAEPFVEGEYDLRIQKIGTHVRAFKRISLSGAWKTNTGSAHLEQIEVTDKYRRWADEASKIFGGLDICTVDAIHDAATGKELILEVNGTSSGLAPDDAITAEDNGHIRDLVLAKMNAALVGSGSGGSGGGVTAAASGASGGGGGGGEEEGKGV